MTDNLHSLAFVPVGQYPCSKWYQIGKRGGWLSVDRKEEITSVMWTSRKETHSPLARCATAVDINKDGVMTAYFESALSLYMKWGYGRGNESDRQRGLTEARWMMSILCKETN